MSNLVDHARRELELCGQAAEDPGGAQPVAAADLAGTSAIPAGYRWPGEAVLASTTAWHYWLSEQPDCGATQLYMVIADGRGEQHIAAERCYLHWGMQIVDALRATPGGV